MFAARLAAKVIPGDVIVIAWVCHGSLCSFGEKGSRRGMETCAVPVIWTIFVTIGHPRMCEVRCTIDIGCDVFYFFAPVDEMAEIGGMSRQEVPFVFPDEKFHYIYVKP